MIPRAHQQQAISGLSGLSGLSGPLAGQRVLITGASGFLGTHLSRRLSAVGGVVHGVSRFQRPEENGVLSWWQTDLRDLTAVRQLFATVKPDLVFHLAGQVTTAPHLHLVRTTFHSLLDSTVTLLTAATEAGCRRFIVPSSLTEPAPGPTDPAPASPYAAAKWASSVYGRLFHRLYGTPVVMARLFMTYGPAQARHRLIPSIILSILAGTAPKVSTGQWEIDWIYVDDVIDGLLAIARIPGIEGETLDLGSGHLISVRQVVQHIVELMGSPLRPRYGAMPDRPQQEARIADVMTTTARLAWAPTTPFESGLRQTIDWYRSHVAAVPAGCTDDVS